MHGITHRRNTSGLLAFSLAAVLFTLMCSAAGAKAGVAANCSVQVDRAVDALTSGDKIDAAQATNLQNCVLSQPAQTADSLGLGQPGSATTPTAEPTVGTVVASFWTLAGISWCVDFRSDGTIAGRPLVPAVSGLGGGYIGTPGVFTLFVVTLGTGTPAWVGLGIGPVVLGAPILPQFVNPPMLGFQTSSC
jgi:hypothetical protein